MATDDFFRSRLDQMIDLRHPLAVLAQRLPWAQIEAALAPALAHRERTGAVVESVDLFGPSTQLVGAGMSAAGRPRLPIRLMASLLYLKHAFNLGDEELVERWAENVVWQFFSGREYYEPRPPCDATQLGRFRRVIGEAGVEELLKATIDTAVAAKAIRPSEFERVIVDTTVQEKAIAHPTDSRLLEIARRKEVTAARVAGINLKQTFAREARILRRVVRRQRTVLGVLLREIGRKRESAAIGPSPAGQRLQAVMELAERIRAQQTKDKNKLYALHAPEVECICKGKSHKPYEFGVKASIAATHRHRLIVGARTFPGNPYDGDILAAQLEQTNILLEDVGRLPRQVVADLGYRGLDADNPGIEIIHRGRIRSMTGRQRRWLRRRQAIEPVIGHLKADHRMNRCWLAGALGDALHAVLRAAGYNLRWLLRAIARKGFVVLVFALQLCILRALNPALRRLAQPSAAINGVLA